MMQRIQHLQPFKPTQVRFGAAREEYKAEYRDFLQKQVLIDPLNTQAFYLIDQVRRQEPHKRRQRQPLHDQLSLFLIQGEFQKLFKGIDAFVAKIRPLLVVAGRIPWYVRYNPFYASAYRLDEQHQKMSPKEADDRLDSMRVVVVEAIPKATKQTPRSKEG